jgi:hypothetical protein
LFSILVPGQGRLTSWRSDMDGGREPLGLPGPGQKFFERMVSGRIKRQALDTLLPWA